MTTLSQDGAARLTRHGSGAGPSAANPAAFGKLSRGVGRCGGVKIGLRQEAPVDAAAGISYHLRLSHADTNFI
jgi:hypothetical protein